MRNIYTLIIFLFSTSLWSQSYTISGYVRDANTGEELIGASIYLQDSTNKGTATNVYGFYSLTLESGRINLIASYTGYTPKVIPIDLQKDTSLIIELDQGLTMNEVVVSSKEKDENVNSTKMGTVKLSVEEIKKLPALLGEVDVLKTIQLLPGVLSGTEGNAGFFVRGGGADQNLILLDEATSSLDAETESKIQEAMSLLTKNKTTIVIAHRLSTILNSHKIFVIEKGEVVAEGTHKELMDNSKIYKNFYDKQVRRD